MLRRINPNHLTSVRLILAPIIMYLLLFDTFRSVGVCLLLMVIAELTDFFDGYIARKNGKVSDLGKIFDPMCDAIYHLMIFLCLVKFGLPIWVMAIFIVRDIIVGYMRAYCTIHGVVLAARWSGKYKAVSQAVFQFAFVAYIFFGLWPMLIPGSLFIAHLHSLMVTAGVVAVIMTIYSFIDYLYFVKREVRDASRISKAGSE